MGMTTGEIRERVISLWKRGYGISGIKYILKDVKRCDIKKVIREAGLFGRRGVFMDGEKMTNHEKFLEVFGYVDDGDFIARPSWLGKEYKGPAEVPEHVEFKKWLFSRRGICAEVNNNSVYMITNPTKTTYLRISDFGAKPGLAYVRWDGLTGWKSIKDIKKIIQSIIKSVPGVDDLFAN